MGDLSPRAADTLRNVAYVAAEDTRRTLGLLAAIGASPRLLSYHAHSDDRREGLLLDLLRDGKDVALVTDAGTPAISDPGVLLVAAARQAGFRVIPIPGPSAVATALSAGGISGDRYLFLGFVPRKGRERRELLAEAARSTRTVVLFEAANRLTALLTDLMEVAGADRVAVVARELTKLHEEIRSGALSELIEYFTTTPARGEVTLVLTGRDDRHDVAELDVDALNAAIATRLASGESRREVARSVSVDFKLPRNEAYRMVMDYQS
jgi:16S rRNA (cytidine1402-2'-O)-methyltransferase